MRLTQPNNQLRSYHGSRWRTCVSWISHNIANTTLFPKPQTTFLTCFSRGKRQKYAGKKVCLRRVSNSQPPGHESDKFTTDPPRWGLTKQNDFQLSTLKMFSEDYINVVLTLYHTILTFYNPGKEAF